MLIGEVLLILGCDLLCDYVFNYLMVLCYYVKLLFDGLCLVIEDLGLWNGIYINGWWISILIMVGVDDLVLLGSFVIILEELDLRFLFVICDLCGDLGIEVCYVGMKVVGKEFIKSVFLMI